MLPAITFYCSFLFLFVLVLLLLPLLLPIIDAVLTNSPF